MGDLNRSTRSILVGNPAEWNELLGQRVQVEKAGRIIRTGYVEAVTAAADTLWIAAEGVEPRALYDKAQGHTVRPLSGDVACPPHRARNETRTGR